MVVNNGSFTISEIVSNGSELRAGELSCRALPDEGLQGPLLDAQYGARMGANLPDAVLG
jgi:hypothetical protein